MKIVFIRPKPSDDTIGLQHVMIVEPLELEILATLVKEKHKVVIYDLILENQSYSAILHKEKPDIICYTGYITHIPCIIDLCKEAKKLLPVVINIVGGVHVEKFPEDLEDESVDYKVIRNATRTFPQLIDYISGYSQFPLGVLKRNEILNASDLPTFDFYVPIPDRSLTSKYRKEYFYVFHDKVALLKTSFGCPYQCSFCFCRQITGGKYYARDLDEVFIELQGIDEKEIYIVDDDFLFDVERIQRFIFELKRRNIRKHFLVYGRADFIASHPEIIRDFKEVGLRTIIVGLESFKDVELEGYNKKTNKGINIQALNVMNQYHVDCYAAVIIAPHWDKSDFNKAAETLRKLKIKFVNLQPLTPLKGIQLDIDERELIIDRTDFARWDLAHVVIKPDNMNIADYYRNILNLYEKIILNPRNLLGHLKYPLRMQLKMARGVHKVQKQYRTMISNNNNYA